MSLWVMSLWVMSLLPHSFRSRGVKGAASSGPLSLKGKTKGRGEHGWWTETTNEQVGWGGPTSARPRPETELVRMWEDSLFGAMGPQRCEREGGGERGGPSLFLGIRGLHLTTAFKQRGRKKERKTPENRENKRKPKTKKLAVPGLDPGTFFRLRGAH